MCFISQGLVPSPNHRIKEGGVTEIRELKSVRGGISVTPKLASNSPFTWFH